MKNLTIILFLLLFNFRLSAQKDEEAVISLTGTAKQYILPDLATINLVIRTEDTNEEKALQKVQERTKDVSNKIKNFGFKKDQIKLTDFSLEEKYTHKKNEGRIKAGYIGQQTVKIKTPINAETISRFLAYIAKNKLENTIINFTTELSEGLEEKTRLQLIEEALQNARTKADLMAKTSSVIIAGIVKIGYNESDSNIKYTRSFNKYDEEEIPDEKGLKSDVTSLLHVEEIEVVESVSVIYKIKDGR